MHRASKRGRLGRAGVHGFGPCGLERGAEPWLNTLVAVNGFNGTLLWKRELTPGIMVDRSTMIATPASLYLADEQSCKVLDAATGEVRDEITVPADLVGGTFWKWMAMSDGVLYALVGEQEPLDRNCPMATDGRRLALE